MKPDLVFFTDLDGTLIDHHSYQPGPAAEAVRRLRHQGIPLVFCSSKTFSEQRWLQRRLSLREPFIFENGSALAIPESYFPVKNYAAQQTTDGYDIVVLAHAGGAVLREILRDYPDAEGFATASDEALRRATGLKGQALSRARDRWFTETLLQPADAAGAARLSAALLPAGWTLSRGGRFYTAQSAGVDKGTALRRLAQLFQENAGEGRRVLTLAAGDSPNDAAMLAAADRGFWVQRPDGSWTDALADRPHIRRVEGVGPAGFAAAVAAVLA